MLKSVMADAKKGDSFMRQNRIKKFLTAGLSGLLILSLTGCGQAAKLPVHSFLVWVKNQFCAGAAGLQLAA